MGTTPANLTEAQILTVRANAASQNDLSMLAFCDAALAGQFMARMVISGEVDKAGKSARRLG